MMLGELARANETIDKALAEFRLNDAATALYQVHLASSAIGMSSSPPVLQGADGPEKEETRAVGFVLRDGEGCIR
jgi:hypothetical protein